LTAAGAIGCHAGADLGLTGRRSRWTSRKKGRKRRS